MILCISKHDNEYKSSKNTQGGWAGGLLLYSGRLSVAICIRHGLILTEGIGSHALIGTGVSLGRWAGRLEELVAQNALHVGICAIVQHKWGRY